jgi:hypothetical protein
MLHREWAVIGKIFQALPNFCPHRQIDRHVQEGTLNTKTTPYSHEFKIYYPGQIDRLTELIYMIVNIRKYKGFHEGHHFISMAIEVHGTHG